MKKDSPLPDPFDEYLAQIQARETSRQRRIISFGFLLTGLFAIGLVFYFWPNLLKREANLRAYQFEELSHERVRRLVVREKTGFLVSHPTLGWDTIHTAKDYDQMVELVELIEKARQPEADVATVSWVEDSLITTESASLQQFVLHVEGEHRVDEELLFTIENYDSDVRYTLDFGNGVKRNIKRRTRYTFPLSGDFQVQLIASGKEHGSSIYTKSFHILPQSRNEIASAAQRTSSNTRPDARKSMDLNLPLFNEPTGLAVPRSQNIVSTPAKVEIIDLGDQDTAKESITPEAISPTKPLVFADVMPEFPGGKAQMNQWLSRRLRYPKAAKDEMIEGRVVVQFVVNLDGSISEPNILKGIGGGCDEEAIRVIKQMPNWVPGELNGHAVPVYKAIPIVFQLL
jgi:TonB family protein